MARMAAKMLKATRSKRSSGGGLDDISNASAGGAEGMDLVKLEHEGSNSQHKPGFLMPSTKSAKKVAGKAGKVASAFRKKLRSSMAHGHPQQHLPDCEDGSLEALNSAELDVSWLEEDDDDLDAFFFLPARSRTEPDPFDDGEVFDWMRRPSDECLEVISSRSSDYHSKTADHSDPDCKEGHDQQICKKQIEIGCRQCSSQTIVRGAPHAVGNAGRAALIGRSDASWDSKRFSNIKPLSCSSIWDIPTSQDPEPKPVPFSVKSSRIFGKMARRSQPPIAAESSLSSFGSRDLWPDAKDRKSVV